MIELKPCPFCGGKARLFVSNGVRVLCTKCGATTWTAIADDADSCKADYLREIIESVPAADVVPVVRCKDCKHLRVRNQKDIYAFCPKTGIVFWQFEKDTRTSFCSDGERMDGGAVDEV